VNQSGRASASTPPTLLVQRIADDATVRHEGDTREIRWTPPPRPAPGPRRAAWRGSLSSPAASGTGGGESRYTIANTSTSPRTGTLTVAGNTVTVTQEAAPPEPFASKARWLD
jgi:hypothetical protein